jgi:hypothetical protein
MASLEETGGEENTATTKRRDRRRTLQVGLAGFLTLAIVLFAFGGSSPLLQRLSALVFDLYPNIKPRVESGAPIVVRRGTWHRLKSARNHSCSPRNHREIAHVHPRT